MVGLPGTEPDNSQKTRPPNCRMSSWGNEQACPLIVKGPNWPCPSALDALGSSRFLPPWGQKDTCTQGVLGRWALRFSFVFLLFFPFFFSGGGCGLSWLASKCCRVPRTCGSKLQVINITATWLPLQKISRLPSNNP